MKTLRIPVYGGRLFVCTSREDYIKVRAKYEDDDGESLKDCMGVSERCSDKKQRSVFLIGVFDGGLQTLVHELGHTTFSVLRHASVPVNRRDDEAFCYLLDCLYEKCAPHILKEPRANAKAK